MSPTAPSSEPRPPTQEDGATRAASEIEPDPDTERTLARQAASLETRKRRMEATTPWLEEGELLGPHPTKVRAEGEQVSMSADPPLLTWPTIPRVPVEPSDGRALTSSPANQRVPAGPPIWSARRWRTLLPLSVLNQILNLIAVPAWAGHRHVGQLNAVCWR